MGETVKEFLAGFGGRAVLLIAGGMTTAFSGFAAKSLSDLQNNVEAVQTSVATLKTNEAVRLSSAFTSADWMRENATLQERFHTTELRLTQMNSDVKSINESLGRIERSLGTAKP